MFPEQTFDYANLAASALNSDDFKAIASESFAGHAKQDQYDALLFVSCHDPDCQNLFAYLSDGRVVAKYNLHGFDQQRADYTIALLNLNSPFLVNRRRRWYAELERLFVEHSDKNWSYEHLAMIDLLPTGKRLSQFFSLTRQFFGNVAEQVLDQH